jgi:hypothetical protein
VTSIGDDVMLLQGFRICVLCCVVYDDQLLLPPPPLLLLPLLLLLLLPPPPPPLTAISYRDAQYSMDASSNMDQPLLLSTTLLSTRCSSVN